MDNNEYGFNNKSDNDNNTGMNVNEAVNSGAEMDVNEAVNGGAEVDVNEAVNGGTETNVNEAVNSNAQMNMNTTVNSSAQMNSSDMSQNTVNASDASAASSENAYRSTYSQSSFESRSAYSSLYGTNNDNNNDNNDKKSGKAKAKKEKKQHGFMFRAVRGVACAVVIGAVAGASCYGAMYAGYINFPAKSSTELTDEQLSQIAKELNKSYLAGITDASTAGSTLTSVSSNSATSGAKVLDVSDIVDNVISSVVAISGTQTVTSNSYGFSFWGNYPQSYEASVSGSGIIIGANDKELLVVTNAHVVENVNNLKVTFGDGAEVDAVIKGMKADSDLAVVAVKLDDISNSTMSAISIAKLGSSTDVKVGEAAIAIGNAAGYGISVTTGIVSAVDKSLTVDEVVYEHLIQTDAAINPGNSGGALFNAEGEVIGINSVKMTDTKVEGMGYAISIESVKDIIDDLSTQTTRVALDNDERGYLGVSGSSVTSEISQTYGWPVGVLIRSVSDGSAAEAAGLRVNDVITSFDGKDVDSWETLVNMMQYYEVGEEVEVTYSHLENGEFVENTTMVALTEKPQTNSNR